MHTSGSALVVVSRDMGNFEEHMGYGIAAHLLVSLGLVMGVYSSLIPFALAVVGVLSLPVTLAGAAFPDIDHPSSKPNRMFRKILIGAGTLVTAYVFGLYGFLHVYESLQAMGVGEVALPTTTVVTVGVAVAGGVGTRTLFDQLRPPHRGMTHRLPVGLAVALGIGTLAWALGAVAGFSAPAIVALPVFGLFLAGVVSHLACDGVLLEKRTYTQWT